MFINEDVFKEKIISRIPLRNEPPLPPNWVHTEMLERFRVLEFADLREGMNVLEVGSGPHALATVPLAYLVGEAGRVIAIDNARWYFFKEIVEAAGLKHRVIPLRLDAKEPPFPYKAFDLAVLIHGIRSLRNEETIVKVISGMLHASERVFLAESLPIANNDKQRAHLDLYNLREEIFESLYGEKDDLHYFPVEKLKEFIEVAGGKILKNGVFEPKLPHYLAYIPKKYVEKIKKESKRRNLERRWDKAYESWKKGAEHPPVAWFLFK